jgi:hypothetical protein
MVVLFLLEGAQVRNRDILLRITEKKTKAQAVRLCLEYVEYHCRDRIEEDEDAVMLIDQGDPAD